MKIAVVSGGFDPIHSGHIAYLKSAAEGADKLIVCLNSDAWLKKKKGQYFLPFNERKVILENISVVSEVIDFPDDEIGSAIGGLKAIKFRHPKDEIFFCNGGDRDKNNIPEMELEGINFSFSVGGIDKKNSSSWILKKWSYPSTKRLWGNFYDLFQDEFVKVKELIVHPNQGMSFQRHFKRSELWFVSHGRCEVNFSESSPKEIKSVILKQGESFHVPVSSWHQITNPFDQECKIIEIQYGQETTEDDIERLYHYNSSKNSKLK
ncbi:adenylyltransferase/cytidyltransferase family protein [Gammaproteobacteria bacterium]|nr:adenylyltransferase/cytidyltransferase family protein [Gammaproteobacteria bacterium]